MPTFTRRTSAAAAALGSLLLGSSTNLYADPMRSQLCWAAGRFDQTMYFAQAEVEEDRRDSFDTLLLISGIDHFAAECVLLDQSDNRLGELKRAWSAQKFEVVNTTFLSRLDY